jgi:hypothetical protein
MQRGLQPIETAETQSQKRDHESSTSKRVNDEQPKKKLKKNRLKQDDFCWYIYDQHVALFQCKYCHMSPTTSSEDNSYTKGHKTKKKTTNHARIVMWHGLKVSRLKLQGEMKSPSLAQSLNKNLKNHHNLRQSSGSSAAFSQSIWPSHFHFIGIHSPPGEHCISSSWQPSSGLLAKSRQLFSIKRDIFEIALA